MIFQKWFYSIAHGIRTTRETCGVLIEKDILITIQQSSHQLECHLFRYVLTDIHIGIVSFSDGLEIHNEVDMYYDVLCVCTVITIRVFFRFMYVLKSTMTGC